MSAVEEIRIKLETHLSELEQEIESLRGALSALDAEAAARAVDIAEPAIIAPAVQDRAPVAAKRRPKLVRAAAVPAAELERELAETGGASIVELARHTGADYGEVLARIRELERASSR